MSVTHLQNQDSAKEENAEDIDLGVLFNLLRLLFKNLFARIGWFFQSVFHWIISVLILFKKHFLKFAIAAILGAILGGIFQYKVKDKIYSSSMTVQANYESIIQLYKDIDYCQGLIKENDYSSLANFFDIDSLEASSIKKIEVKPYANDNQIVLAYNDFIAKLDTAVIKNINFDKFSKNLPKEEFLLHVIYVESTNRMIFGRLEKPILKSVAQNPYYSKMMQTEVSNLKSQEHVLNISMIELDSLRQLYKTLAINESIKENATSNIFLGNNETDKRDIVVFDKYIKANIDLVKVKSEMNLKNEIINVVSSFNKTGARVKGLLRNSMVTGFLGGIFLVLLYLIIIHLNQYLVNYQKKTAL